MDRNKENLLAAAKRLTDWVESAKKAAGIGNFSGIACEEFDLDIESLKLAAHLCRLAAHASDGFEAWMNVEVTETKRRMLQHAYIAGTLAASVKYEQRIAELEEKLQFNLYSEGNTANERIAALEQRVKDLERFEYLYESASRDIAKKIRDWEVPITPESHPMEQNVGTVILWTDAALSDLRDLCTEVRRCWNNPGGTVDRPPRVREILEREKE